MRPFLFLLSAGLFTLLGCQPQVPAVDLSRQLQPFEQAALQRMNARLTGPDMVGGGPLTPTQLHHARDQWLESVAAKQWLGTAGIEALKASAQDKNWEQALTGVDTRLVVDTIARIQKVQTSQGKKRLDEHQAVRLLLSARANVLDLHTHYVPASEQQDHNDRTLRRRVSVGLVLAWLPETAPVVEAIAPEAGAAVRARIKTGDRLVAVYRQGAWQITADQTPLDVMAWLRGTTGGVVRLRLEREGRAFEVLATRVQQALNEERLRVHRETVHYQGRTWTWLRLELKFFYEEGTDENGQAIASVAQDLEEALKQAGPVDGVVMDLRRCRGGAIEQALALAGLFTGGGPMVSLHNGSALLTTLKSPVRPRVWTGPVQVWVGPNTASSGEALAMALHDRVEAPLVGWPSYGKGTLQRRMELDMQAIRKHEPSRIGELWWTFGVLAGPGGERWQKQGLPLDLALPNPVAEPWGERAADRTLPGTQGQHASHLLTAPSTQDAQGWRDLHATNEDGEEFTAWKRVGAWVWAHRQVRNH